MTYRKKTLRRMSPTARKIARLAGELDSVSRRLKNLIPDLQELDLDSKALINARQVVTPEVSTAINKLLDLEAKQDTKTLTDAEFATLERLFITEGVKP